MPARRRNSTGATVPQARKRHDRRASYAGPHYIPPDRLVASLFRQHPIRGNIILGDDMRPLSESGLHRRVQGMQRASTEQAARHARTMASYRDLTEQTRAELAEGRRRLMMAGRMGRDNEQLMAEFRLYGNSLAGAGRSAMRGMRSLVHPWTPFPGGSASSSASANSQASSIEARQRRAGGRKRRTRSKISMSTCSCTPRARKSQNRHPAAKR